MIKPCLSILTIAMRETIFVKIHGKQVGINLLCVGTIHNMFVDFYNCNLVKWFTMLWTIQKAINDTFVLKNEPKPIYLKFVFFFYKCRENRQ